MDALKRAEKARQAEASSDGAELDLASTQGFSLDPIDESDYAKMTTLADMVRYLSPRVASKK